MPNITAVIRDAIVTAHEDGTVSLSIEFSTGDPENSTITLIDAKAIATVLNYFITNRGPTGLGIRLETDEEGDMTGNIAVFR